MLTTQEQKLFQAEEQRNSLRAHLHTLSCRCDMWERMLLNRCASASLRSLATEPVDLLHAERTAHRVSKSRASGISSLPPTQRRLTTMRSMNTDNTLVPMAYTNSRGNSMSPSSTTPNSRVESVCMTPLPSQHSLFLRKSVRSEGRLCGSARARRGEAGVGQQGCDHYSYMHDADGCVQHVSCRSGVDTSHTTALATQDSDDRRYHRDNTNCLDSYPLTEQTAFPANDLLELQVAETWGNPYAKGITMLGRQCDGTKQSEPPVVPLSLTMTHSNRSSATSSPKCAERERTDASPRRSGSRPHIDRQGRSRNKDRIGGRAGEGGYESGRALSSSIQYSLGDLPSPPLTETRWHSSATQPHSESDEKGCANIPSVSESGRASFAPASIHALNDGIYTTAKCRTLFLMQSLLQTMRVGSAPAQSSPVSLSEPRSAVVDENRSSQSLSRTLRETTEAERAAVRRSMENIIHYLQSRTPANAKA